MSILRYHSSYHASYSVPLDVSLERPRRGPLNSHMHFARNCSQPCLPTLPLMEIAEETLAVLNDKGRLSALII